MCVLARMQRYLVPVLLDALRDARTHTNMACGVFCFNEHVLKTLQIASYQLKHGDEKILKDNQNMSKNSK